MSQAEFCRRRSLALATFRYHRARSAAQPHLSEPPRVVELFAEPATHSVGVLRLELDFPFGPVTVHGQAAPLAELLRSLVSPPVTARA
jgi:hypothetical protein